MCIHHVTVDFCTNIYTSTGPPSFCCYDYLCMRPIRDFAWILRDSRSGNVIVPLLHLSVMFYVESVAKSLVKRLGDNKRLRKMIFSAHSLPGQHLTVAAFRVDIF